MRATPPERIAEARRLHAAGRTQYQIAVLMGTTVGAVKNMLYPRKEKRVEVKTEAEEMIEYSSPGKEAAEAFLTDLTALSLRHGIIIGGCGCCGSPFLTKAIKSGTHYEANSESGDYVSWEMDK